MLGCSLQIDESLAHPDGVGPPTTWLAPGEMQVTFAKIIGEPLVEKASTAGMAIWLAASPKTEFRESGALMVFVEELPWLPGNDV